MGELEEGSLQTLRKPPQPPLEVEVDMAEEPEEGSQAVQTLRKPLHKPPQALPEVEVDLEAFQTPRKPPRKPRRALPEVEVDMAEEMGEAFEETLRISSRRPSRRPPCRPPREVEVEEGSQNVQHPHKHLRTNLDKPLPPWARLRTVHRRTCLVHRCSLLIHDRCHI